MVLEHAFMDLLDSNQDGEISHEEFTRGFAKWFARWNPDNTGTLTDKQLRAGINRDLFPFPGGPGFGPPDGPPPGEE